MSSIFARIGCYIFIIKMDIVNFPIRRIFFMLIQLIGGHYGK